MHRGFVEVQRRWESRLNVHTVDLERFEPTAHRVAASNIRLTTFAAERARRGERLVRETYDLEVAAVHGEPRLDPDTMMSFDRFVVQELEEPHVLHDGHFMALDGDRLVGLSRLARDPALPGVLQQGFTCVHPEYRGRGIALALKLETVRYALQHGFDEIRTQNDTTNAPMLHINDALGFERQPARVVFELKLG